MAIKEKKYNNEIELQVWLNENYKNIFGDIEYFIGDFKVYTSTNKGGIPDAWIIDFQNKTWGIIEVELIKHGVWKHIAEQIVRFIVSSKSLKTKKIFTEKILDSLDQKGNVESLCKSLSIPEFKLQKEIESILEYPPKIHIFIDKSNSDLEDMANALDSEVNIFCVKKFETNGIIEYLCKDNNENINKPTIQKSLDDSSATLKKSLDLIKTLDDKFELYTNRKMKFYKSDSEVITTKLSKTYNYQNKSSWWYGIKSIFWDVCLEENLTHMIFILGDKGFVKLPTNIVGKFIKNANTSNNPDGSVIHWHVKIAFHEDKFVLYTSKEKNVFDITEYYTSLD